MNITVEPKNYLSEFIKDSTNVKILKIALKENAKISNVLEITGIPREKVNLIIINDKISSFDSSLRDGDKVILFPAIMGG